MKPEYSAVTRYGSVARTVRHVTRPGNPLHNIKGQRSVTPFNSYPRNVSSFSRTNRKTCWQRVCHCTREFISSSFFPLYIEHKVGWNTRDLLTYALGIGAKPSEKQFVYGTFSPLCCCKSSNTSTELGTFIPPIVRLLRSPRAF